MLLLLLLLLLMLMAMVMLMPCGAAAAAAAAAHDAARPLHAADVVAAHADFLLPALLPLPDPPPILCCSQHPLNSPRPCNQFVAFSVPRTYNIATREF